MATSIEAKLGEIAALEAKSFVATYSTVQTTLITAAQTGDPEVISDVLNRTVGMIAKEFGIVGVTKDDLVCGPTYDECIMFIDEKVRIVRGMTVLLLVNLVDKGILDEFLEQIDELADVARQEVERLVPKNSGNIN